MTVKEALIQLTQSLSTAYSAAEAESISFLVMEELTNMSRVAIRLQGNESITPLQQATLLDYTKRLLRHEPVQYVLEYAWFGDLCVKVNPAVLIPRPETAELVQWIISDNRQKQHPLHFLDVGTGSGIIPISIAKAFPNAKIEALDVSDAALEVARKNASKYNANITLHLADFSNSKTWETLGKFDIICSNPPYIPEGERHLLDKNVILWEPATALFVPDPSPLIFYELLAAFALDHLSTGGALYVECHQQFAKDVCALFQQKGFNTALRKDIFDNERMVKAWEQK